MDTKEKNRGNERRRPASAAPASGAQNRRRTADTVRQEEARQSAAQSGRRTAEAPRRTAPRGTGPRMSAPQRSAEEAAKARSSASAAARTAPRQDKKKTGKLRLFSPRSRKGPKRELTPEQKAQIRRKKQEAAAENKRKRELEMPPVVYTQPTPFNRDRLLVQLLTIAAIVVAVILGMSVFFKVETITVAGTETYSPWAVREASGIQEGDNLLTFSKSRAVARIRAELDYVDEVRIGIKLPDTVIIYVEELEVAYAVQAGVDGDWWLMTSNGRIVEQITEAEANSHTQVLGVTLDTPTVGDDARAAELVPMETLENGDPVPITVTGAQRLSSALEILKALEANDIVGEAASINVSSLEEVVLWYGNRYEVLLGDTTRMEYKIACMNDAIYQMSTYQSGILDVSFYTRANEVIYTPFG